MPERPSRLVGILGGMGPAATVDFYDKLVRATPALIDQEHLRIVIWADPTVPNRQEALLSGGQDPTPWLDEGVGQLLRCGAEILVAPCNTVHAYLPSVLNGRDVEFLSIIEVTMEEVQRADSNDRVGLLATDGALASGLYQSALGGLGRETVLPSGSSQQDLMRLVHAVKAGRTGPEERQQAHGLLSQLRRRGVTTVIAGCTEISVLIAGTVGDLNIADPSQLLAEKTVRRAYSRTPTDHELQNSGKDEHELRT
ncbi:hypothetical protein SA2016_0875 [Sinomonas atrocyanea]|uniref:Aspartate racemase n=1 Tax=Sinomonas atrocyanea TaxID=37927 RepID=A0A126ZWU3_9MICC|nr:amino acid racemase [Sinomonas atrocyanea]AMM31563.1 hypothetical protein SA2016_0875 [Sinomonas atrocyanea]GEB66345.1 aspartate racemase [Sinomonas atrocyanea]GGG70163.1 aspartate racemase [Sinomonas atrocyanea]